MCLKVCIAKPRIREGSRLFCLLSWFDCGNLNCLKQIFNQFEFLWLPVKGGHCRREGFGQPWDYVVVLVETGRIAVSRQLLQDQQKVVRFNCLRGVLSAKLWLTCGAHVLLLSWLSSESFLGLLSPCDVSPLELLQLGYWYDRQKTPLRYRGRLGNDPQWVSGFLSCCCWMLLEQLRNKSEIRGQKEFIKFKQSTQNAWLRPAKSLWKVFSRTSFQFLWNCGWYILQPSPD